MAHQPTQRLLARATASRCTQCPPDRVCAWACVQGMNVEDIVIGAMLERGDDWAFQPVTEAGQEANKDALWDVYNR